MSWLPIGIEFQKKGSEKTFKGVKIKKPTDYPWDREDHIIEPAGVCWHIREG